MSKLFLTGINLNQNALNNAQIQNLASAPSSPVQGQVYFDTTQYKLLVYNANDTSWELIATNSLLLQGNNGAYYLNRSNHTGTQLAATISNLNATVIAYTLDTFAAPVASVSMNSQKITNLATPSAGTDAANKAYVDANIQGLSPKPTARAATAAALPTNTYSNGTSGVGATLTATTNAALTVDGYSVAVNDVILVKNEVTTANNGLYVVTAAGSGAAAYVLTRHVDMDQATEFGGALIPVENVGTANANSLWLCNVANTITVGTTSVVLTQLNSATTYTQGNGISISGLTISAVVQAGAGLTLGGSGLAVDTTKVPLKYSTTFGDGSSTSYTITHNLGTQNVMVTVYLTGSPYNEVECDINHATTNTVTLLTATAPTTGQYTAVVHG